MADTTPSLDAGPAGGVLRPHGGRGSASTRGRATAARGGDLSYVQFQLLARLGLDSPTGSERMTDLADGVVYSRSGLTYQAGLLEKRAWSPAHRPRTTSVASRSRSPMPGGRCSPRCCPATPRSSASSSSSHCRARTPRPWPTCCRRCATTCAPRRLGRPGRVDTDDLARTKKTQCARPPPLPPPPEPASENKSGRPDRARRPGGGGPGGGPSRRAGRLSRGRPRRGRRRRNSLCRPGPGAGGPPPPAG